MIANQMRSRGMITKQQYDQVITVLTSQKNITELTQLLGYGQSRSKLHSFLDDMLRLLPAIKNPPFSGVQKQVIPYLKQSQLTNQQIADHLNIDISGLMKKIGPKKVKK